MRRPLLVLPIALLLVAACGADASQPSPTPPTPTTSTPGAPGAAAMPSGEPSPSAPSAGATARPTLQPAPILEPPAYASRVTVPELGIDLPIVSGDLTPPPSYPFCDVAAYVTRFGQPYEEGVTYLSAHAQEGMFLPLLEASLRDGGQRLIGQDVVVYTNDGMRYSYRIDRLKQHATDYTVIDGLDLSARTLILQTSEGPYGTVEKLQVVASFVAEESVPVDEATPTPMPRDCRPPELRSDAPPQPTEEATSSPVVITAPTPAPGSPPPLPPSTSPATPGASPSGFIDAAFASRVVVPSMGIDLPVVSGDLRPPPNYPFCDVAAYVTFLSQPQEPGTTYLTAHAQEGMFLPLLEASQRDDGAEMLGMTVDVYTTEALRYRYEVWQVRRHITDRAIATDGLTADERRLVLQTSEGPDGTLEKLGIVGRLVEIVRVDLAAATPEPRPRDCSP